MNLSHANTLSKGSPIIYSFSLVQHFSNDGFPLKTAPLSMANGHTEIERRCGLPQMNCGLTAN